MEAGDLSTSMYEACLMHSRADRAMRMMVSRQLERFDVTMMEWLLMGVVDSGPPEGLTMTSVALTLDVTLPQVTALAASLVKAKLLKQKVSRQDRRSRRLISTPACARLLEEIEETIRTTMKAWTADVPQENLAVYFETIKQLAARKTTG